MSANRSLRMLINSLKINVKLIFRVSFLFSVLALFAFANKADDNPFDKLVTTLQRWTDSIPQEKVYLHTDKPYYALGDTIWFKGYVTIGSRHQLSALSGAVYVDLINAEDSTIRALKLPVTSGMIMGNFILGDDYNEGSYRIRAYTQWMRNAGSDYFYDRTFTVGSIASDGIISKAHFQYKDVNNKPVLTALLNFTDDEGKAIGDKTVRYEVVINKRTVWAQNTKTDALGSININVNNDNKANLNGAYIRATVGSVIRTFPIKAGLSQTDIQFFPEGGNLVNGISSRVAFKAIGIDGLGLTIKGSIVDDTGKEITPLESLHAGMGSFTLRPMAGKTYEARITFADGSTKTEALPKATDEGYVLSVYQPNADSVLVRISSSQNLQQGTVNIIAQTRGENVFASPIKLSGPINSVWLDKKLFPSGIAQFTLFNLAGEPLNERIAFIRNNTDRLQLSVKTAKTAYKSKEPVRIDLSALNGKGKPTFGNFSVAVTDESKVPVQEEEENTILNNLLLTSDLKGYVEMPNYYFTNVNTEVNRALDNLMLSQGYRRFAWKELAANVSKRPAFEVEGLGFKVSGRVEALGSKKLLAGAKVNLLSVRAGVMKGTTTDSAGRFLFDGIFLTDSIKFSVEARDAKNSDKVKVILDTLPKLTRTVNRNLGDINNDINTTLKKYIENGKKLDDIYEKYGQLDKVQRLREVRIKAKRVPPPAETRMQGSFQIQEQSADKVVRFTEEEALSCNTLAMCLQARLPGITINTVNGYTKIVDMRGGPLVLILDGRKINSEDETAEILDGSVAPEDVAKIMVVRTNMAAVSVLGGPAIMILTRPASKRRQYNPNVANIDPKGFNKVREFYQPRYDKPGSDKLPDLRSTIYWNPYLKTDTNGKASFNFFNADGPGNYKVVIEGINADGELGRVVYRYTVEAGQGAVPNLALQPADKDLAMITAPLDSFNKRMPVEKVYLHTDKPYYNIGDTLWFKGYLIDKASHTPSKLSGLLYVELDNDTAQMVRRISIPVKDGLAWGQIPLTKAIFEEGSYNLRAYTNWMQNFGEDYVFNQQIYIGTPSETTWLVKTTASVNKVGDKNQLRADIKLFKPDNIASPVALKKVQVKIFDEWHYLFKEELQTGIDGSIKLTQNVKDKADWRKLRAQIISLEKDTYGKVLQIPLSINRGQNIDLQFLPEGGSLVSGLTSVVGFKAVGEDGKGTPVLGGIYDSKNEEVVSFNAMHNGMGSFEFTPKAGEKYSARMIKPAAKSFDLPKIKPAGTVMRVENSEQGEAISINIAGLDKMSTDTACYLIGTSRGGVYFSQKLDLSQANIAVAKKLFPSGIAKFTLFKGKTPLNERAVFIDNQDQLSISIKPNKAGYNKRDSVGLEIEVKDKLGMPVTGSFSVAVTDDSQVDADSVGNNSIAVNLLLNSDIKGFVESPGYYLNRKDKKAWQALDNLMLTQGWTGYDWKDIFNPAKRKPKYETETELKITGVVTKFTKKPVAGAQILLSSKKPRYVAQSLTDAQGVFTFRNLPAVDSGSFFVQAKTAKGGKLVFGSVALNKFKPLPVPENNYTALPWYINTDSIQLNYMKRKIEKAHEADLKLNGNVLKEVKINAKKIIPGSFNRNGPGKADLSFDAKDIKESATQNLYELIKQKLPGIKVVDYRGMPTLKMNNHLVVIEIDGGALPLSLDYPLRVDNLIEELSSFPVVAYKGMEVLYSRKFMVSYETPPSTGGPPAKQIMISEATLKGEYMNFPYTPGELSRFEKGDYYISGISSGYLETRANVKSFIRPDIAVVVITTVNGDGWKRYLSPDIASYRPIPVLYAQQFYSPKYNVSKPILEQDYRSTLHWQPNVSTDANGKAKVSFYTSDIKSNYTIKIAGADVNGGLGDGIFKLKPQPNLP
jgi:hypothetical protein